MKILLLCKGEYRYWFPQLATILKAEYDFEISALAFTTASARQLQETGLFREVHSLAEFLKRTVPGIDLDAAIRILDEADSANPNTSVNTMIYADRIISPYPRETVLKMTAGLFLFWKQLLQTAPPDLIIGEVSCAAEWIGWSVAKQLGIRYLIPYCTPIPDRFYFVRVPDGIWQSTRKLYSSFQSAGLPAPDRQQAETFLATFRREKVRSPVLMFGFGSPFAFKLPALLARIGRIRGRVGVYAVDGIYEVGSYDGTPPWKSIWGDISRLARYAFAEGRLLHKSPPKGKTVYFALHMQPEFTTDVRAPFWTDQVALIHYVAKSLPPGYQLVVKEHPAMKGERPLEYYRRIGRHYNVHLVSAALDSHDLIKACDAVLTITGTTAWEGLLYEKPVIAFGPLCYDFGDLVYRCTRVQDLRSILTRALTEHRGDRDRLLQILAAALATAHPGKWGSPIQIPAILELDNLRLIAQAIQKETLESRALSEN